MTTKRIDILFESFQESFLDTTAFSLVRHNFSGHTWKLRASDALRNYVWGKIMTNVIRCEP